MDKQGSGCSSLSLLAAAASSPSRLTASAWHEQTWWSQRLSKKVKTAGRRSCGERRAFS